jgi:hypothetical protein
MDSLWSKRERHIFSLELGGQKKLFDPMRLARSYHQAVMDAGGIQVVNDQWKHYNSKADTGSDEWLSKWNNAAAMLALIGNKIFSMEPWDEEKNPDGMTDNEAIDALAQYLLYSAKKGEGAGNSSTASTASEPGPAPTKEESPSTPITSASSTAGT